MKENNQIFPEITKVKKIHVDMHNNTLYATESDARTHNQSNI